MTPSERQTPLSTTTHTARGSSAPLPAVGSGDSSHQAASGSLLPSMASVSSWLRTTQGAAEVAAVPPANAVATFRGSWLSHLDLTVSGGAAQRLWTLCDCAAGGFADAAEERRLPTDCTFREDIRLLAAGDVKGAEAAKARIEEQQRRLRKRQGLA